MKINRAIELSQGVVACFPRATAPFLLEIGMTDAKPAKVGQTPLTLEFLERNPRVKGKRIFALVLFGDTTRFRRWRSRPFLSSEKHARFMIALYDTFIRFRNGSGYFVKLPADGLM